MKSPACACAKKTKRKSKSVTQAKSKQVMKSKAEISKFSALRAPIMANTSGVFDRATLASSRGGSMYIPGFAPINAFPYPGISQGNTSQMYGLLTGSNLADLAAANIYRVQDKRDDVASGLGVTGLKPAPKGNVTARKVNLTNASESIIPDTTMFESFSNDSFVSPRSRKTTPRRNSDPLLPNIGMFSPVKQEQIEQSSMKRAIFNIQNDFAGDTRNNPLNVLGVGAPMYEPSRKSGRITTLNPRLFSPQPMIPQS